MLPDLRDVRSAIILPLMRIWGLKICVRTTCMDCVGYNNGITTSWGFNVRGYMSQVQMHILMIMCLCLFLDRHLPALTGISIYITCPYVCTGQALVCTLHCVHTQADSTF